MAANDISTDIPQLYTGNVQAAAGIVGSISTQDGFPPVSTLAVEGGGQVSTVTEWVDGNNGLKQVPIYAWVASATPRVTVAFQRGIDFFGENGAGEPSPKGNFVLSDGTTQEVSVNAGELIPDPTNTRSVGTNGAQYSWLKKYSDLNNPFLG